MDKIHRTEYCLYCYEPLQGPSRASQRCERCGKVHLHADHATYWTRERRLVEVESLVKFGIFILVVIFFFALANKVGMGPHRINTFFIGPLVMLGGVLWWTAGLITRKPRYFSPRVLWISTIVLLILGPPVLLFVLDVIARKESFGPEYWKGYLVLASPGLPMLLIAVALHFLGDRFQEFKRKRISSGRR